MFERVKGRSRGMIPTEATVSLETEERPGWFRYKIGFQEGTHQTPMNSMSTFIENAFLKAVDRAQPILSSRAYMLYAKGTC